MRGAAWFDDITVSQLPRLRVVTQSPINVIRMPDRPQLSVDIHDMTGRALMADLKILDVDRRVIAQTRQPMGSGTPLTWAWTPPLSRAGWYTYDLSLEEADGRPVTGDSAAHQRGTFLWLTPDTLAYGVDGPRFSIDAQNLPDQELTLLPQTMERLGMEAAVVSAFDSVPGPAAMDDRQALLDRLLQATSSHGRMVTLSLAPLPPDSLASDGSDANFVLAALNKPTAAWLPLLTPILLREGQRVRNWQLGPTGSTEGFDFPGLPTTRASNAHEFQDLAPQPVLELPWRLDLARPKGIATPCSYAIETPDSIAPEKLGEQLAPWRVAPAADFTLQFREPSPADPAPTSAPPSAPEGAQAGRARDLALRMIYGWEAGAQGITLSYPWTPSTDSDSALLPNPTLGVFINVSHRLDGRRAVGRLALGPGLTGIIFNGPAGGMVAAWNSTAPEDQGNIDLYLGTEPVAIDIWGNRTSIPMVNHRHPLHLTRSPVFIEGVDAGLSMFRAAFKVDPAFIESTQTMHPCTVTLANPWPQTISGYMDVIKPGNWRIEPRRNLFTIASGQTAVIHLDVGFPITEPAGHKRLIARFDFTADQHYTVDLGADVQLGLKDVDFEASVAMTVNAQTGKTDAVVTQVITNTSGKPLAIYAFATLAGHPRQERIVSGLLPGQSTVRRFRFEDATESVRSSPIRVGLRETQGPAILTKMLSVAGG